jgi:methionyl-tRNA formyltransferase
VVICVHLWFSGALVPDLMRYRVVFFGTPEFAVPTLQALLDGPDHVVGVVCQPDKPAGRGQQLHAPPVKQLAARRGVPVAQPVKLKTDEFPAVLRGWAPDLAVVAAYGRILPRAVLDLPRLGCINVHASLLPKYRGAAPIQWALRRGESVTGVTIMSMNERMDEGDILLQRATPILPGETYGALQQRLAGLGAVALMEALAALHAGTLRATPQEGAAATYAPMIEKQDGAIDWTQSAQAIALQVRAFNPWPSAFTTCGRRLKIHRARALDESTGAPPGTVLALGELVRIATGAGVLGVEELQLEGKRALPAREFARGGGLAVGERLGAPAGDD